MYRRIEPLGTTNSLTPADLQAWRESADHRRLIDAFHHIESLMADHLVKQVIRPDGQIGIALTPAARRLLSED